MPPNDDVAGALSAIEAWRGKRTYAADNYTLEGLLARKDRSVSVILPARNVENTIGGVLGTILPLREAGLLDELLVIDAGSEDGTASEVKRMGIEARPEVSLFPDAGPSLGKGDALWRGLAHTSGDIVVFFDTDTQNFGDHFVLGMLGPLFEDEEIQLVKAGFHRPLQLGGAKVEDEGGRVTELVARPLINMYFPMLAGFVQPLAGEVAGRRELLESLPIPGGYGVEIAMLIDAFTSAGMDALAEVDLGRREDLNQPLRNLTSMAYAVTAAVLSRAGAVNERRADGLVLAWPDSVEWRDVDTSERPPVRSVVGKRSGS